jgi:hypothetical protein
VSGWPRLKTTTKLVSQAIEEGATAEAINYFIATKYTEALGQLPHHPTPRSMIPLEAASLIPARSAVLPNWLNNPGRPPKTQCQRAPGHGIV